jgi:putative transposase
VTHRAIEISYRPRSRSAWQTHTAARREAARLWSDLAQRHFRIRRRNLTWPSKARWQRWVKRRYPGLSAQSAQQIVAEFCEAVQSARQLRKHGGVARFPWRRSRYRDVLYTNQDARLRHGRLILPNGTSGTLRVRLPAGVTLPGRLMEVRLGCRHLLLVCEVSEEPKTTGTTIGVDLGVNTLIAATDGDTAVLINGREAKATVQWRNKRLASLSQRQSRKAKGSRRWRGLQRRKRKMLAKAKCRIRDLTHKATRLVADAFANATCYVGKPFNAAAQRIGRVPAQSVSQACNARLIRLLDYKTAGAVEVAEHYSSQTCPVCGGRRKCRRTYRCECGVSAPRDVIGSRNVLCIGQHGGLLIGQRLPGTIKYLRPRCRSSSGGHPARSSHRGGRPTAETLHRSKRAHPSLTRPCGARS